MNKICIAFVPNDSTTFNSAMIYLNNDYVLYEDIIVDKEFEQYKFYTYNPIEKIETIWSNEIIEDVPSDLISNDYFVSKTWWDVSAGGIDHDNDSETPNRYYDYDYHIFRYSTEDDNMEGGGGHLLKLIHPSYFYHYGYHETPDAIEEGFYNLASLSNDVMIYAPGGMLREGERVAFYNDTIIVAEDTDGNGVVDNNMHYIVDKEFDVELDSVKLL